MAGIVDSGLHDTVLVLPGERVRIAMTFKDFEGLYLYHCHNMEHEDNGMMRYYEVRK
jgi:FtsP/CotA-like multicopper oxidase with cupredoxin domain